MLALSTDRVQPGMRLVTDIDLDGRPLLRAGVELSPYHLDRLRQLGICTLYVHEPGAWSPGEPLRPGVISAHTRRLAFRVARDQVQRLKEGAFLEMPQVMTAVRAILEEVLSDPWVVAQLSDIRAMQDQLFGHLVSTCAYSVLTGLLMGWDRTELVPLAVGAILHDVGKVRISEHLWDKPDRLTEQEYEQVQLHTRYGYEMLRHQPGIDARSAHVAWQHHERWDGTGYPRRLRGEGIHRFARVVAVADVFDALTTDRPYRHATPRHEAFQMLQEQAGKAFDPQVVRTFLARVAPYPVGMRVRLSTGEQALVAKLNPKLPARPLVWIDGVPEREVDLGQDPGRRIVGPVDTGPRDDLPAAGCV